MPAETKCGVRAKMDGYIEPLFERPAFDIRTMDMKCEISGDHEEEFHGAPQDEIDFERLTLLGLVPKYPKYWWHYAHFPEAQPVIIEWNHVVYNVWVLWQSVQGAASASPVERLLWKAPGNKLSLSSVPNSIAGRITSFCANWFVDRYVRRSGCVFIIVSAILKAAAQSYTWWSCVQIFQGIGSAFVSISATLYVTETVYPDPSCQSCLSLCGHLDSGGSVRGRYEL